MGDDVYTLDMSHAVLPMCDDAGNRPLLSLLLRGLDASSPPHVYLS